MKIEEIAKYFVRENTNIYAYTLYLYKPAKKDYPDFPDNFSDKEVEIAKYLIDIKNNEGLDEYYSLEDKIEKRTQELSNEKALKAWESYQKRQRVKEEAGEKIKESLKVGDIVLVEYSTIWNKTRAIKILGLEDHAFIGRYLDREVTTVPIDEPEEEGYLYARKYWDKSYKWKWDGKTFRSTDVLVTKKYKFVKEKLDNIVILNRK